MIYKQTSVNEQMTNLAAISASKLPKASMDTPHHNGHISHKHQQTKAHQNFGQMCWMEINNS